MFLTFTLLTPWTTRVLAGRQRTVRSGRQRPGENRRDHDVGGDGGRRPRIQGVGEGVRGPRQQPRVGQPTAADRRPRVRDETQAVRQLSDDHESGNRFADSLRILPSTYTYAKSLNVILMIIGSDIIIVFIK